MDWLKRFGGTKKNSEASPQPAEKPIQSQDDLDSAEMGGLLDSFMRTCWPSNYGDFTLGVDTQALKQLRGPYLAEAKAAILHALEKSPDVNSIGAADSIEMTEAIPVMIKWVQHIRPLEDKRELRVAYGRLAYSLYNFTKDEAYLTDLAEAVRVSGFGDMSGSDAIHCLWNVPLTLNGISAVWEKLKKRQKMDESSSWVDACESFLRAKLDEPVGRAFLSTLPETEREEIQSIVATTIKDRIERNRRFEHFVVRRYNRSDLNIYWEYIKVGGSPIPGLTLRCILEGHTNTISSAGWSPDGNYLVSAASDNLVVVWDVRKGDYVSIIDGGEIDRRGLASGHNDDDHISQVAWSADGEYIAFGSEKKGVSVWNFKRDTFLVAPKRSPNAVRQLAWAPGSNSLLHSYSDNTVWIRDVPSQKVRQIFQGLTGRLDALAWSSDAAWIAAGYWDRDRDRNVDGSAEDTQPEILVWDVKRNRIVSKSPSHHSYIEHIASMPEQPIFAAASADHTISIWNVREGRRITSLESHASRVSGVSFSAGGVLLASTAERDDMVGATVRLWRIDTWEELMILKELDSANGALAFHPTLPMLATRCHGNPKKLSGNSTASFIRIWDLDFDIFLKNPPFMDEFDRLEADLSKLS